MAVRLTLPHPGTKQLPRVFGSCVSSVPQLRQAGIIQLKLTGSTATPLPEANRPSAKTASRCWSNSVYASHHVDAGLGPGPSGNTAVCRQHHDAASTVSATSKD